MALRDAAHLRAVGDADGAAQRLSVAFQSSPGSTVLAAALIEELGRRGDLTRARATYEAFAAAPARSDDSSVLVALATAYLEAGSGADAKAVLDRLPSHLGAREAIDAAILERRAGRQERAHRYFEGAGEAMYGDARALLEFAQTKIRLARPLGKKGHRNERFQRAARERLLSDARDMLRRGSSSAACCAG